MDYYQQQRFVSQQQSQQHREKYIWHNMGIKDTLLCRFSCDTNRFRTVYYFLKPNNHGEKRLLLFEKIILEY